MSKAWILVPLIVLCGCGGSDPKPLPMNEFEVTITPDAAFNGETATMETGVGIPVTELAEQSGDIFFVNLVVYSDDAATKVQGIALNMLQSPLIAGSTFQVVGNGGNQEGEAFGTYSSRVPSNAGGQWGTLSGTIVVEEVTKDYVRIRLENVKVFAESTDPEFGSAELNGTIQLIRKDR